VEKVFEWKVRLVAPDRPLVQLVADLEEKQKARVD